MKKWEKILVAGALICLASMGTTPAFAGMNPDTEAPVAGISVVYRKGVRFSPGTSLCRGNRETGEWSFEGAAIVCYKNGQGNAGSSCGG